MNLVNALQSMSGLRQVGGREGIRTPALPACKADTQIVSSCFVLPLPMSWCLVFDSVCQVLFPDRSRIFPYLMACASVVSGSYVFKGAH